MDVDEVVVKFKEYKWPGTDQTMVQDVSERLDGELWGS
jgi:hypothetical protein